MTDPLTEAARVAWSQTYGLRTWQSAVQIQRGPDVWETVWRCEHRHRTRGAAAWCPKARRLSRSLTALRSTMHGPEWEAHDDR